MTIADPNRVILTGENPFIRLCATDSDNFTTTASFWRIYFCAAGPGHVLYLKSELTENRWRIYSDNIAMARWLQTTVQGMLNAEIGRHRDPGARRPVRQGRQPRHLLDRAGRDAGRGDHPHLVRVRRPAAAAHPADEVPGRRYGLCTVLVPSLGARLTVNGVDAAGKPWPREREGRPFSTCALAFSESWTEER